MAHRDEIYASLWQDLHKSESEALLTEISIVLDEIKCQLLNLRSWARPKHVVSSMFVWPSKGRIELQPLGTVLIIAPWNYPFQLALAPLVGAVAAGNCAVVKPSDYTPNVALIIEKIITEAFDHKHVIAVQGGREVNSALLAQRWDHIFFTGSPELGRVVMRSAAENLTGITLELGGKSPCVVDRSANVDLAARRIVWGKFLNAGQTCIAPDYVIAHHTIKKQLTERMVHYIAQFYGQNPEHSLNYGRIVNDRAFQRLKSLIDSAGNIVTGGECSPEQRYIAPTLIDDITPNDPIMQQEIFGPLLPMLDMPDLDYAINLINSREKPLALYYFGKKHDARQILNRTSSGGACINDTVMHVANHNLPFGGVGGSGMGRYHGRESLVAFSNRRAVLSSPVWLDLPLRYPPFKFINLIKRIL